MVINLASSRFENGDHSTPLLTIYTWWKLRDANTRCGVMMWIIYSCQRFHTSIPVLKWRFLYYFINMFAQRDHILFCFTCIHMELRIVVVYVWHMSFSWLYLYKYFCLNIFFICRGCIRCGIDFSIF